MNKSKDVYLVADNKKIFIKTINIRGGYPHWLDSLIPDTYKKKYGNRITNIIIEDHQPGKTIIAVDDLNDNKRDEQDKNINKRKLIRYNDLDNDRELSFLTGTFVTKEIIAKEYPCAKKHNHVLEIEDDIIYSIDSLSTLKSYYKIPDNIKDHIAITMIEDKLNNIVNCKDDENILNKAIMKEIKDIFYNSGCFSLKDRDLLIESDFEGILNNFICDDTIWNDINCTIHDLIQDKLESKTKENFTNNIMQLILSSKSNPSLNFISSINNILDNYDIIKKNNNN